MYNKYLLSLTTLSNCIYPFRVSGVYIYIKSAIFDQMGHRQATTSRQKRQTKLHSVPRGKADDHERSFKEHS